MRYELSDDEWIATRRTLTPQRGHRVVAWEPSRSIPDNAVATDRIICLKSLFRNSLKSDPQTVARSVRCGTFRPA